MGIFSECTVVRESSCMPVDPSLPFEQAVLVGCGVTAGWSSVVLAGGTHAGDTVVVFGCGGLGSSAVQGTAYAGAERGAAVDLVDFNMSSRGMPGSLGPGGTTRC